MCEFPNSIRTQMYPYWVYKMLEPQVKMTPKQPTEVWLWAKSAAWHHEDSFALHAVKTKSYWATLNGDLGGRSKEANVHSGSSSLSTQLTEIRKPGSTQ